MDEKQFHRIAKALADPTRFQLLERISAYTGEMPCSELAACFPLTKPTLSHHLKELTDSGLVESRRESRFMYLKLHRTTFNGYLRELRLRLAK
jgi:ArsR family transcriptional regulator